MSAGRALDRPRALTGDGERPRALAVAGALTIAFSGEPTARQLVGTAMILAGVVAVARAPPPPRARAQAERAAMHPA